jgi:centromere protein C
MILGRSEEGPALCPVFKGFLEIPKEVPDPLGTKQRKRSRTARSASRGPRATSSRRSTEEPENVPAESQNPEAGWDDDTPVDGDVMDFVTQQELHRRMCTFSQLTGCV